MNELRRQITEALEKQEGTFAVAFKDLATGEELLLNERETFHAASTMKTPVLIEAYKQAAEGRFSMKDSILIKNEFSSIVDGSQFSISAGDDSEQELYTLVGQRRPISELLYKMIIQSSNLATNIIIEQLDAKRVTQSMRELGARDIQVLRGVEDIKAYEQGLNNTTTAYDLLVIFEQIAEGSAVSPEASQDMIGILLDQRHREIIPAKLPGEVKVAHKTGWITGVRHDSGIVILPDGRKYVLVLLSKELKDDKAGMEAMANVSELIYKYVAGKR
ncbi:serine hydrolase [Pontibacter kalidii]|uniref:serine hydrolase n=1 Tax=Pontibacter kalidii TaxID=2592049 RepID=UPI002B1CB4D3|nr:serine hydrolase [Pontibacter kalidii]